jgi:hypothetical protein
MGDLNIGEIDFLLLAEQEVFLKNGGKDIRLVDKSMDE